MSIISDAIKRARKENSTVQNEATPIEATPLPSESTIKKFPKKPREKKITFLYFIIFIILVGGSLFLYENTFKLDQVYEQAESTNDKVNKLSSFLESRQKIGLSKPSIKDIIELNGIAYGPDDKWAIINDKIVREGDSIPGGALILIKKDSVTILKNNGQEISLDLN